MKITFLAVLSVMITSRLTAQPGSLDLSFGNGTGHVSTMVGSIECRANAMAIQPDGKIVVAGYYKSANMPQSSFAVVRYNYDGSLDNSFAGNGKLGISFSGNDQAFAVVIQPDKKILVAGYSNGYCALARVSTTGVLDNNFGVAGKAVLTGFGSGLILYSAALTSTGQIVLAGTGPGYQTVFVARLNANSSPDNGFGTAGLTLTTLLYNFYSFPTIKMALQPDGKPVLTGTVSTSPNLDRRNSIAVLRYTTTGVLDPQFAGTGYEYITAGAAQVADGYAVTIDPQNRIMVAGDYYTLEQSVSYNHADFLLLRFNQNGTLDNSFAGNGKMGINFLVDNQLNSEDFAYAIAVQSNGFIAAAGITITKDHRYFSVAGVNSNGTPDNDFSGNGKVATVMPSGTQPEASDIGIDLNHRIVVLGNLSNQFYLLRYIGITPIVTGPAPHAAAAVSKFSVLPGLYPNPSAGTALLTGLDPSAITQYTITDASGKKMLSSSTAFAATAQINTAQLRRGVYFIQLTTNNKTTTLRMVKE